ncbi:hypothetical protein CPB86DRAFT_720794 [Serendipita vermifera]|nr:hypothetical protein CPB86DRAFT_720794 [Serendipita vermifera]
MLFRRNKNYQPPVNPALFLTQALRTLEEAKASEDKHTDFDTSLAYRKYGSLVQTYQTLFSAWGNAEERLRPLSDKHLILQLIQAIEEAAQGFDRTYAALPLSMQQDMRGRYYQLPYSPVDVSASVTWLRGKADELPNSPAAADSGPSKAATRTNPADQAAPSLPEIDRVAAPAEVSETCLVCVEIFGEDGVERPTSATTAACLHPANVCKNCISLSIAAHIDSNGVAIPVACPDSTCSLALSRQDVKQWAADNVFARWDMLTLRDMMRHDQGLFVWCQNPNCYSGQLHAEGESQPIVTCLRCSRRTCFTHNVLYHEGQTCKQYDRSRPLKDAVNRTVSRAAIWWRTRNCPGCFQPIEKNGGCRHMHCRCGYYFTWWYAPIHWRRLIPFIKARSPGI